MKLSLFITLLFLQAKFIAQYKPPVSISVSLSSLEKSEKLQDLLPEFPADCRLRSVELVYKNKGRVLCIMIDEVDDSLAGKPGWRKAMLSAEPGSVIGLSIKRTTCTKPLNRQYKIKVINSE